MARWKLAAPHYLNVDGTKWEYHEVSRSTGKAIRTQLPVPAYLDPRDPADFTHKWGHQAQPGIHSDVEGEIIVCQGHSDDARDVIFIGDPTPDMIPLDDEAKKISASFEPIWRYKPETEIPCTYSQSLVDKFQIAMAEVQTKPAQIEGLSELVAGIAAMVKSNQEVISKFGVRRV
jgi:hypothetical protein